jgi:prolyl oligopeptidase
MVESLEYPSTRREIVREVVGGIAIEDPYRWLEADTPEALAWGEAQSEIARDYIRSWEHFDTIQEQLSDTGYLFISQSYNGPARCGDQWIHVVNRRGQYPQLMVSPEPFGDGEVVFNPDNLPEGEPRKLHGWTVSPDGRYVALNLVVEGIGHDHSGNGPTRVTVSRIVNVETKESFPISGGFAAWNPDSTYFSLAPHENSVGIFIDRPGEKAATVPDLEGVVGLVHVSADGRYAALLDLSAENKSMTAGAAISHIRDEKGWRAFPTGIKGKCQGAFLGDAYVAIVTEGSPKGRVVSIPVATPEDRDSWTELIPESDRNIRVLSVVDDRIVLALSTDAGLEIEVYTADGTHDSSVPLPPGQVPTAFMIVLGHDTFRACPGGFYFMHNPAFAELPTFYNYNVESKSLTKYETPVKSLGELKVTLIDDFYSADGTQIPIRLVHRPDLDMSQARPLLLHGYGNLDLCFYEPPAWFTPFLDAGGVYAWVTLRGGGDHGDEWRHGGREYNKGQCSIDFCDAGEHLVAKGIAERDRMAAFGFSGGAYLTGIVTGRLGRQARPDLFKTIIGLGGCYDLFTYVKVGGGFSDEWGDPTDNPQFAKVLADFSAYQNVQEGLPYPTILIASTNGDQGWPGHGRKMTAALQHATSADNPILHRVLEVAWHGELGAISGENGPDSGQVAAELTAFVMRELDMKPV